MAPAPAVEVPGLETISWLGAGGFGSVWEATDPAGNRVAVKVSHAHAVDAQPRFDREAAILALIGPPHVPGLHGHGLLADGRPYLVMELLTGGTLAQQLERWSSLPELSQVQAIGGALLQSVAALHARGVVHRDLKPENVFLSGSPVCARLMDFGFSHAGSSAGPGQTVSAPGAGTPEYMAPEQITGHPADTRVDVYALGIMLFELVTLRLPFVGDRRELEYAHLSFRPAPPSEFAEVPAALDQVILRCLAKEPAARFADAGAALAAFTQAFSSGPEAAPRPITVRRAAAAAATPTPLGGSERHKMVLLFAQGPQVSGVDIQPALQPFGGQVAHLQGDRATYAFDHRAGNSPLERALEAARALLARGFAQRVFVDVGEVAVKQRRGATRLFGAVLADLSRYPTAEDPPGILLAAAAAAVLPSRVGPPVAGRPGCFVLRDAPADPAARAETDGEPPLVGRAEVLRTLLAEAATALAARRPRVASVLAAPGLGLTRLAHELARSLGSTLPGAELIELRPRQPMGDQADDTLARLLRRTLELPMSPPSDEGRGLLGQRLGALADESYAAVALLLGWIAPDHPEVRAARAAPGALQANLARAAVEGLRRLAAGRPTLIVLDDAHFTDDTLLEAIEQASTAEIPLWVCALARPVFAEGRPLWGQRAAHFHSANLGPLDPESAAELCRHLLLPATNVPEQVIARLTARAEGVPLLLCDLVRGLRREGLVGQYTGGACYVASEVLDRMPDSPLIEWIAGRELDRLPSDLAAHARLISLLFADITIEEMDGVLGGMERALLEVFPMDSRVAVQRLEGLGLIVEPRAGTFSFRNRMIGEAIARRVNDALAAQVHRSALGFYRGAPLPEAVRIARLAWHAARAGQWSEAATAYLTLAESARERHSYLESDVLYTQALGQLPESEELHRFRALKGRGVVRYRLGRYQDSREDLARARALGLRRGDVFGLADVMLDEAMASDWLHEYHRARELAEGARDLLKEREAPALQARVLQALGSSLHRFNKDQEAVEVLREACRQAEAIGDDGYEVQVTAGLMLGFLLPFFGRLDEAEAHLERVARLCEARADHLHLSFVWSNRACLWIARNDRARFMEDTERCVAHARRMGQLLIEIYASFNAAYFFHWRGEFAVAEPFVRRRIELEERLHGAAGFRPEAKVLLGRILWGQGEESAARAVLTGVKVHQAAAQADTRSELLLSPNDQILLEMMDLVMDDAGNDRWQALVKRAWAFAQGQELIEVMEMAGLAARRRGSLAEARRWWEEARAAGELIPNVMSDRIASRLRELGELAVVA
jgi:tetratricopeptide (TPR) repeat protein